MKQKHTTIFLTCSFFVSLAIAAIFCSVALVAMIGKQMPMDELPLLFIQTTIITWLYIVLLRYLFEPIVWLVEKCKNLSFKWLQAWLSKTALGLLAVAIFSGSNAQTTQVVNKDAKTGITTTYSGLKAGKTTLVMNGEELNHTDIPLGESFVLVNSNVTGLTVKDGKVSIGCSLQITDNKGKILMNQTDLFKETGGVYENDKARQLKCTVNTGKPMDWDQTYTVKIKFWDKNGKASISHLFKINTIDIP
jgi:hypothetical protein